MDLMKAIKERRSVRVFQPKKVSMKLVHELVEAASFAPSACNQQLWKFVVITDQNMKNRLIEDASCGEILRHAPVVIAVFYLEKRGMDRFTNYMSASAAIQNMLLRAHELGLGACWVSFRGEQLYAERLLDAAENAELISFVVLGYPAENPKIPERTENIVSFDSYQFVDKDFWEERNNTIRQTSPTRDVFPYGTRKEFENEIAWIRLSIENEDEILFYLPYDGTHMLHLAEQLNNDFKKRKLMAFEYSGNSKDFITQRAKHFFMAHNANKIEFVEMPSESFECIVCTQQLEEIRNYVPYLKEMHNALKPNGKLVLSFRNSDGWFAFSENPSLSYREIHKELVNLGFKVEMVGISFLPFWRGNPSNSPYSKLIIVEAVKQ